MTVNEYVKKWCDEDYDVRKEEFYVENAYYVAKREWSISGFKHGIFAIIVSVIFSFFTSTTTTDIFLNSLLYLGILTVCFWFYGIRNYDANSVETSVAIYVLMLILLLFTKNKVPEFLLYIFTVVSFVLFVYLSIYKPIRFIGIKKKMKQRILEEETEEENNSKDSYAKWQHAYKAYRYGLPEGHVESSNPLLDKARSLFEGYTNTKQMLKTRYRALAKEYHPDLGGDAETFRCIIEVYEQLNKQIV